MTIAAIDPGGTTGIAWCKTHKPIPSRLARQLRSGGETGDVVEMPMLNTTLEHALEVCDYLVEIWDAHGLKVVLIEDFVLRKFNMKRDLLWPVAIKAHLEALLAVLLPEVHVIARMPHERSVMTADRMKAAGLWVPGKPHGRAAVEHLVAYLRSLT